MDAWCTDVFDDMLDHLTQYDEEDEFELRPVDNKVLHDFFIGTKFSPILTALDTDALRVADRMERKNAVSDSKEYRRDVGLRELSRWLDEEKEFDEDEFNQHQNPKLPMRYGDWLDLIDVVDRRRLPMTDDETGEKGRVRMLAKAIVALTSYATNLHWKLDHLLHHTITPTVAGTQALFDQLLVKYPFLARCDDHVANVVPNEEPIELGRTSKVRCLLIYTRTYTDTQIYTYNPFYPKIILTYSY